MSKIKCIFCNSENTQKDGRHNDMQRYKCLNCRKRFTFGKYNGDFSYIIHFNTKIKKKDSNSLTRDNYCTPSREVDYTTKKNLEEARRFFEHYGRRPLLCPSCYCNIPNEVFSDYEHFTEEFVRKHYENCMRNFDLNMEYCETLDFAQFDKYLKSFVKKHKFREITDLQDASGISGIYILVLDKYKQIYIGKTQSSSGIKERILSHWNRKKEFSRLIYGNVEDSILSIDVFGALDTTRIFIKECRWFDDINAIEQKLVENFDARYRLNRVAGGLNGEDDRALRNLELINSRQKRNLIKNQSEIKDED